MYQNLEAINGRFREQREMQREIEEIVSFIIDIGGKKIYCYRTEKTVEQTKPWSSVGLWPCGILGALWVCGILCLRKFWNTTVFFRRNFNIKFYSFFQYKIFSNVKYFTWKKFYCKIFSSILRDKGPFGNVVCIFLKYVWVKKCGNACKVV